MRLYNKELNKIINVFGTIKVGKVNKIISKLSVEQLNEYGYYPVKYSSLPDRTYYNAEAYGEIKGNFYVVKYKKSLKPVEPIKEKMIQEVIETAKKKLDKYNSKYSPAEMIFFIELDKEARDYLATGDLSKAPLIKQEADAKGKDYKKLALEIVNKADSATNYRNYVVSTRYKKIQEIKELKTIDDIINYRKYPIEVLVDKVTEDGLPVIDKDRNNIKVKKTKFIDKVTEWGE